ncbi:hypothetical protein D5S17_04745 [Pseudonocardiaceae bacterium YIM PH 21723]|nr:hypothetical protein D5S17_04745 [Pseudonocardiaceae bacterium YIM PH 21723]
MTSDDFLATDSSAARVYDWLLGGSNNTAADRALGERFVAAQPQARMIARMNRAFLRRSVLYMVQRGIRQFLDIGSGIPTVGNVHEIAHRADPDIRVLYVDKEHVAVAHSQLLLTGEPGTDILLGDLAHPVEILGSSQARKILDLSEPIGLLMLGVLHFVPEAQRPYAALASYRDRLAPGSHLAISHLAADMMPTQQAGMATVMNESRDPMYLRDRADVLRFFDGFDLVEPGLVCAPQWRPESPVPGDPTLSGIWAGVAELR